MSYVGSTPTTQNFIAGTDQFTGNGSSTNWTLSRLVNAPNDIQVTIANVVQNPTSYSVSGNTLTISPAVANGVVFYVRYLSTTLQSIAPGTKTVGIEQFSATGTPSATTFLRGDNSWAEAGFASGTRLLFQQTTAPTGWTKDTSHDNKALRVVSGSVSSGGSVAFTTAFASQAVSGSNSSTTATGTVGSTTLTTTQIPSHTHQASVYQSKTGWQGNSPGTFLSNQVNFSNIGAATTESAGGGGSHNHTFAGDAHSHTFTGTAINLAVQYVDVIIAVKN